MPGNSDDRLVSVNRASELFEKDRSTIRRVLSNTEPAGTKGRATLYTLDAIGRALYGEDKRPASESSDAELRRRKLQVEVDTMELEYQEKLGNVADVSGVVSAAIREGQRVRDKILRVPSRVAAEFASQADEHTIKIRLEAELRIALEDSSSDSDE